MWSFRNLKGVAAAAALVAAIGVAAAPVHAHLTSNALTHNALTHNALTAAGGSAIDDLNGVSVEAVTVPDRSGVDPLSSKGGADIAFGWGAGENAPF